MTIRVLLVLAALAVLYGCGQASSPTQGQARHQQETQRGVAETQPKTVTAGCLGQYRNFGSVSYSPDGQKIVFTSFYDYDTYDSAPASTPPGTSPDETDDEICVANADGTDMARLTDDSTDEHEAVWSPDGTKIAFVRSSVPDNPEDEDIFVMNADGSSETKLRNSAPLFGLDWSPDSQEIAFGASQDQIYIMRADGSGTPRALLSDPAWQVPYSPAWSPDGKWIAFQSGRDTRRNSLGDSSHVYVMQVGDTDQWRQLTDSPADDSDPTWSPDGTKIAFARSSVPYSPEDEDIFVMNADGSNETKLRNSAPLFGLDWSPDGKHVAYLAEGGLFVANADGSNPTLVIADRSE